jgi:hypothetical protein
MSCDTAGSSAFQDFFRPEVWIVGTYIARVPRFVLIVVIKHMAIKTPAIENLAHRKVGIARADCVFEILFIQMVYTNVDVEFI